MARLLPFYTTEAISLIDEPLNNNYYVLPMKIKNEKGVEAHYESLKEVLTMGRSTSYEMFGRWFSETDTPDTLIKKATEYVEKYERYVANLKELMKLAEQEKALAHKEEIASYLKSLNPEMRETLLESLKEKTDIV